MPPPASPVLAEFDPIGVGELWSGILLGVVGVFAVIGLFALYLFWDERRALRDDDGVRRRRPLTRGVLICDWVDVPLLTSVANQTRVEPEPVRRESSEGGTTGGGVEAGGALARMRTSRERRHEKHEFFELAKDPNALLVKVLGKVGDPHGDTTLLDNLDEVWGGGGLLTGDTLDDIIRTAKDTPELEAAREAVQALQGNAVREQLISQWEHMVQDQRFALIESTWAVQDADVNGFGDEWWLRLNKLRQEPLPSGIYTGDPPEHPSTIDMPDGLGVVVRLPRSNVTEQGRSRLVHDNRIKAGVFGTTASLDQTKGELWVAPIAVFARVES